MSGEATDGRVADPDASLPRCAGQQTGTRGDLVRRDPTEQLGEERQLARARTRVGNGLRRRDDRAPRGHHLRVLS
jgi:hypothetical protein